MDKLNLHRIPSQPLIRHRTIVETDTKPEAIISRAFKQSDAACELKISKHASERLTERNIHISDAEWAHVTEKVNEAKIKGNQRITCTDGPGSTDCKCKEFNSHYGNGSHGSERSIIYEYRRHNRA